LVSIDESELKPCSRCAKCCFTHPCALAPSDLGEISTHFGLSEEELFTRFLVLDYVEVQGVKRYFVCPSRRGDQPGTRVKSSWVFSESPCIFLDGTHCSIEEVKPKSGRSFYCGLMTRSNRNFIGYSKKKSASDWANSHVLDALFVLADKAKEERTTRPVMAS
jgi:Fe-S-cluster containining protein